MKRLGDGITPTVKDIIESMASEEEIKQSCGNLKTLLDVMETFGGEEVVEF